MVGESQFTSWRKDIMKNISKALEESDGSARREVALAAVSATAQVMMAERIGQLSWAVNRNDEMLSVLHDRITTGEQIAERLVHALNQADDGNLPEGAILCLTMMEDWLAPDGPVKFNPPDRSQ